MSDLSGRLVDELSGGQRQRVWVAMVLAQETGVDPQPQAFVELAQRYATVP